MVQISLQNSGGKVVFSGGRKTSTQRQDPDKRKKIKPHDAPKIRPHPSLRAPKMLTPALQESRPT